MSDGGFTLIMGILFAVYVFTDRIIRLTRKR